MREQVEARVVAAVEFADASPEPPLDTLYDNLYVVGDQVPGWYAVDERSPGAASRRARGRGAAGEARELAEAGAAYAGQAAAAAGRKPGEELDDREAADALEDREEFVTEDDEGETAGTVVS